MCNQFVKNDCSLFLIAAYFLAKLIIVSRTTKQKIIIIKRWTSYTHFKIIIRIDNDIKNKKLNTIIRGILKTFAHFYIFDGNGEGNRRSNCSFMSLSCDWFFLASQLPL